MKISYTKAIDILNELHRKSDWYKMMIKHKQYNVSENDIASPEDLFVALGLPPSDVKQDEKD